MNGINRTAFVFTCRGCQRKATIQIDAEDMRRYRQGIELIQNCFPYLSTEEREMLMTQTCGACWDSMFMEPERQETEPFDQATGPME